MKTYSLTDEFYFGKFKGKTIKEVIDMGKEGKNYLSWAMSKPILDLDEDAKDYLKTGKVKGQPVIPKTEISPKEMDFWQRVALQGPIKDIPF